MTSPPEVMHSTDKDNKYKVRKNWWQGAIADIDVLIGYNVLSKELKDKYDLFYEKYKGYNFASRLTAKEDINEANQLIKEVLNELQK